MCNENVQCAMKMCNEKLFFISHAKKLVCNEKYGVKWYEMKNMVCNEKFGINYASAEAQFGTERGIIEYI